MARLLWWRRNGKAASKGPKPSQGGCRNTTPTPTNPALHAATDSGDKATSPSFPAGVQVLHDCLNAAVDVCFVHGLSGDRESTWTARGQSGPWPKTLLPLKLGRARILTYGYDAYVVRKAVAGRNRLLDHATNLLHDLATDRDLNNASSRPLIFVAHNLGGLVCKKALLLSRDSPEVHIRAIFNCSKGIIFMGTPHQGSWMADWAKIPASALGLVKSTNMSLLEILQTKNQLLESIQVEFWLMVRALREAGRRFEVTCFFEELPLPVIGKVVSKESATVAGYDSISIHANCRDMVRFASAEDNGFRRLLGVLARWTSEVKDPLPRRQMEKLPPASPPWPVHSEGQRPPAALPATSQECLRSLAFPQMRSRAHNIGRPVAETCEWLPRHQTYRAWASCDRGLLWIKGKPGSGKSTLLKHALDKVQDKDSAVVLSFFFDGRGDGLQSSSSGLFRSLLHQILGQTPDTLQDLVCRFETKCREYGKPGQEWHWHEEELRAFLESSLLKATKTRPVWLFVDALDECGEDDAVGLVEIFKKLLKAHASQSPGLEQLRICLSCRHYPILDMDESKFEICVEYENETDISTFVQGQLAAFSTRTSSTIPASITEDASGVFMWARCAVKKVLSLEREGAGLDEIRAAISSTPSDLDKLYQQLVSTMGPGSLKLAQLTCFATLPLSLDELRWAMLIEADCLHRSLRACKNTENYIPDNRWMKRRVQALGRGLVEVTRTGVVQFIHRSAKDYFVEKGLAALDGGTTSSEVAIRAHSRFFQICMRYLAMEEIGRSPSYNDNDFPFLRYAATSWVVHAQQCGAGSVVQDGLLALFAWPPNALVESWLRVYQETAHASIGRPPTGIDLVRDASRDGVSGSLKTILQMVNETTGYLDGKNRIDLAPLSWASAEGHKAAVKLLPCPGKIDMDTGGKNDSGAAVVSS